MLKFRLALRGEPKSSSVAVKRRHVAARDQALVAHKAELNELLQRVRSREPIKDIDRTLDYSIYNSWPLSRRSPFRFPDGQDAFLSIIQAFFRARPGCASLFLSVYGFELLSDGKTVVSSQLKFSRFEKSWTIDAHNMKHSDMWHLKDAMNNEFINFSLEYSKENNVVYLKRGIGSIELVELWIKFIEAAKQTVNRPIAVGH
jgi:hypothetical protein